MEDKANKTKAPEVNLAPASIPLPEGTFTGTLELNGKNTRISLELSKDISSKKEVTSFIFTEEEKSIIQGIATKKGIIILEAYPIDADMAVPIWFERIIQVVSTNENCMVINIMEFTRKRILCFQIETLTSSSVTGILFKQ
jgi:hypothetical protein